jgi:hypothetical protein
MCDNSFHPSDELHMRVKDQLEHLESKGKGKQFLVAGFQIGEEVEVYSLTNFPKGGWAEDAVTWFYRVRRDFCAKVNQPDKRIDVLWLGHRLNWIDEMMFSEAVESSLG